MTYGFTLTQKDIIKLGAKATNAKEYTIEQNGWTGKFSDLMEVINNKYGAFKGNIILKAEELTGKQEDYIIKNCKHKEY